jgi:actin-related protein 6
MLYARRVDTSAWITSLSLTLASGLPLDLAEAKLMIRRNPRSNTIVQEYVLPDFSPHSTSRTGYIRSGPGATSPPIAQAGVNASSGKALPGEEDEQVLYMGNERFAGPELLFNPSDIGKS